MSVFCKRLANAAGFRNQRHLMELVKNLSKSASGSYEQGQSPEKGIREYFYFIDHQGQLFLDDAKMKNFTSCFKERDFLVFFYKRIRKNDSGRYEKEFPFVSLCGRERNFIRCDDVPIVYTNFITVKRDDGNMIDYLSFGNVGNEKLAVPFNPHKICMLPRTGRVYYPAEEKYGGVGLIKSSLAIELSNLFVFEKGQMNPKKILWKGSEYILTNELIEKLDESG